MHQIALVVTTDQEISTFTVQTMFVGALASGFTEISPGLYSRTEVARSGSFTFINLRGTGDPNTEDFTVKTDGNPDEDGVVILTDRQKGVTIEAADPTHELTVYVLSDEQVSTDAYMAINCVEFPSLRSINVPRWWLSVLCFLINFCWRGI